MTNFGHVDARTQGGLVRYTIAGDRAFVDDAIARIMAGYPTPGYGTHFSAPRKNEAGDWVSHGSRYTSCD